MACGWRMSGCGINGRVSMSEDIPYPKRLKRRASMETMQRNGQLEYDSAAKKEGAV